MTPNTELTFARNELRSLAETLQYTTLARPEWRHYFVVDGVEVADTLTTLADRLEDKFDDCPCIGRCTRIDTCRATSSS